MTAEGDSEIDRPDFGAHRAPLQRPRRVQNFPQLHLADFKLQRFARYAQKMIGRIGQSNLEATGTPGRRAKRLSI